MSSEESIAYEPCPVASAAGQWPCDKPKGHEGMHASCGDAFVGPFHLWEKDREDLAYRVCGTCGKRRLATADPNGRC